MWPRLCSRHPVATLLAGNSVRVWIWIGLPKPVFEEIQFVYNLANRIVVAAVERCSIFAIFDGVITGTVNRADKINQAAMQMAAGDVWF